MQSAGGWLTYSHPMPPLSRLTQLPKPGTVSPAETLARVATNLRAIAGVLAEFPARSPAAWNVPERAKDLKDLQIACERLQDYARRMEEIAASLPGGRGSAP